MATLSDSVFTLDVGEDLEIENFKVSVQSKILSDSLLFPGFL